jgi:hypothetical protein
MTLNNLFFGLGTLLCLGLGGYGCSQNCVGWGWFLFLAFLLAQGLETKK